MPFLSIIIPVYNKGQYLNKCIQSIVDQSFTDWEIILVDDGSTDSSPAICDQWSAQHSCIKVIHQKNAGVSTARNEGMKLARGEYLQFTDADDWWDVDAFQTIHQEIKYYNTPDLLIFGFTKITKDGICNLHRPETTGMFHRKEFFYKLIEEQAKSGVYGCVANKILSRKVAIKNQLLFNPKQRLLEDFDFFLSAYNQSETIAQSHYSGYFYLQDAENSSSGAAFRFHYPDVMGIRVKAWQLVEDVCGKIHENDIWLENELNIHFLSAFVNLEDLSLSKTISLYQECVSLLPGFMNYAPRGTTINTQIIAFLLSKKLIIILFLYLKVRQFVSSI